jgi:hypothetical protein
MPISVAIRRAGYPTTKDTKITKVEKTILKSEGFTNPVLRVLRELRGKKKILSQLHQANR